MDEIRHNQAQIKNDIAGIKMKQNQTKVGHSLLNFTLLDITRFFSLYCMDFYLFCAGCPIIAVGFHTIADKLEQ